MTHRIPSHARILGAGPAGLSAALVLARRGVSVDVHELLHDCGARFHGDLQGIENFSSETDFLEELSSAGIAPGFLCTPFRNLVAIDPDRRRFELTGRDSTIFYLVRRGPMEGSIDRSLKLQAIEAGVRIHFGTTIPGEEADIIATGTPSRRVKAVAFGIVFDTDHPDAAFVLLDNRLAYRGYAYLLITQGSGCLCSALFSRFEKAREQFHLAREALLEVSGANVRNAVTTTAGGTFSCAPKFRAGPSLCAGEAAGLMDPLWGFGIRCSMASGRLAARALLGEVDYLAATESRFGPQVRAGIVNRFVYEIGGNCGYRHLLQSAWASGNFRTYLNRLSAPSLPKTLGFPLAAGFLNWKWPPRRR